MLNFFCAIQEYGRLIEDALWKGIVW